MACWNWKTGSQILKMDPKVPKQIAQARGEVPSLNVGRFVKFP